jgi:hypothetical protein
VQETRRRRASFAVALALAGRLLGPLPAPAGSDREAELRELLAAAGASWHVQEWPELTLAARERAQEALDAGTRARLERGLAEAFAPEALLAAVASRLAADPDAVRMASLRAWYDSPPGRRIHAAQERATTPDALRELPVFVSRPAPGRVPPATLRAVQRIARATRLQRSLVLVARSVSRGIDSGTAVLRCREAEATAPPGERRRVARLERLVPERTAAALLFAYRDVATDDLAAHAEALESDAGRWLFGAFARELETALDAAERSLRERLAAEAAPDCSAPPGPADRGAAAPGAAANAHLPRGPSPSPRASAPRRARYTRPGSGRRSTASSSHALAATSRPTSTPVARPAASNRSTTSSVATLPDAPGA